MTQPDERMLLLMEYAVKNGLSINEGHYWEQIFFQRTGVSGIRKGRQSFRVEHIINACSLTGASADWVLGLSNSMFRDEKGKTAIELLKEATAMLEGRNIDIKERIMPVNAEKVLRKNLKENKELLNVIRGIGRKREKNA